jgi:hypothetical protein
MGANRWSHAIAKGPPRKIRIVHVVEPTVIKTDARQFRELVQRLTGKPSGGGGDSSSSSSAEIVASESSSSGGSESDRDVVAPVAVKAVVKAEEDAASLEEEGLAGAFGELLGDKNGAETMAAGFKAEVKEAAVAASPEEEGFTRAFREVDDTYDAFFQGLDDFLLSNFQADGFCL